MKWSWKIAEFRGIGVYMHATFLILIGFVAQMKSSLGGIPVAQAMQTDFRTLSPNDTLERGIDLILAGAQQDFPVVDDGRVVGILTRNDLLAALTSVGRHASVSETMQRQFETVDAAEMLETAFQRFQSCECRTVPVLHRGELSGLLTMENVGEFIAIQAAIETKNASAT